MDSKQKITIRLADYEKMPLLVPDAATEEIFRNAEVGVNELWARYTTRYPSMDKGEILAMVAFQFAKLYFASKASEKVMKELLTNFEERLNNLIVKVQ